MNNKKKKSKTKTKAVNVLQVVCVLLEQKKK